MNKILVIIGMLLLIILCAGCVDKGHTEEQASIPEDEKAGIL